jgi:hypothetical protein
MPVIVETEGVHFLHRLFNSPIVFGDAIGGHDDAGAVFTVFTMDKNLLAGRAAQESEELSDLFVGRRHPATDRNVDVAETERFGLLALGLDFAAPAAKIDDGGDAKILEFAEPLVRRLRAAKEKVVYFARIRNSGECDFLPERGTKDGNVRSRSSGRLCASNRRPNSRKEKNRAVKK